MNTKRLGNTELELTVVGLGTWAIGGAGWQYGWGAQDETESIAAIRRALDLGVNWIDTAPVYGLGHAEQVVAKAVQGLTPRPIIATKCGLTWDSKRNIIPKLTSTSVRAEVEASLKRLRLEVIDLYQIHWPQPKHEIEEAWDTLARLREQGKIRYAGVCNFSKPQLERVQARHPVASLQPPYSMLQRDIEKEHMHYCAEQNIGMVVYSPLQKGVLTDKFCREFVSNLPSDDHRRHHDSNYQEPRLSQNLAFVTDLRDLAHGLDLTVAQLAVAWVLRRSEVTAAIVGARNAAQIEDTVQAAECTLSEVDLAAIERSLERIFKP